MYFITLICFTWELEHNFKHDKIILRILLYCGENQTKYNNSHSFPLYILLYFMIVLILFCLLLWGEVGRRIASL